MPTAKYAAMSGGRYNIDDKNWIEVINQKSKLYPSKIEWSNRLLKVYRIFYIRVLEALLA
jgi:hypothetical protein